MADAAERRAFDRLPAGVTVVKDYTDGTSLLECSHSFEHQYPLGGYVAVDEETSVVRPLTASSHAQAREALQFGEELDYRGLMRCRVCGGDENTTLTFSRPVKMVAVVKDKATATLF
jgi:hypothetical protein